MAMEQEFREVVSRLNGLCASVEGGFREVKAELKSQDRVLGGWRLMFFAVLVVSFLAMAVAGYAAANASTNRALIVELIRQMNEQQAMIQWNTQQQQDAEPARGP